MNRQLKMVFSRSNQPAPTPAQIPAPTPAHFNPANKSIQPTLYTQSVLSVQSVRSAQINPANKSMFNIGNKSCGCG